MKNTPIVLNYIHFVIAIPVRWADEFVKEFGEMFYLEKKPNLDKSEPERRHFEIPIVPAPGEEEAKFISQLKDFCETRGLMFPPEES